MSLTFLKKAVKLWVDFIIIIIITRKIIQEPR